MDIAAQRSQEQSFTPAMSMAMDVLPNTYRAPGLKAQLQQGYHEKMQTFIIKRPSVLAMGRHMAQVTCRTACCLVMVCLACVQSC